MQNCHNWASMLFLLYCYGWDIRRRLWRIRLHCRKMVTWFFSYFNLSWSLQFFFLFQMFKNILVGFGPGSPILKYFKSWSSPSYFKWGVNEQSDNKWCIWDIYSHSQNVLLLQRSWGEIFSLIFFSSTQSRSEEALCPQPFGKFAHSPCTCVCVCVRFPSSYS